MTTQTQMDIDGLLDLRDRKDAFFRDHPQSPLTPHQQHTFTGLSYYDPNPNLILKVTVDEVTEQDQILMQTTGNELRPFFRYGTFNVSVAEESATLTIYRSPDGHFFLPFVDGGAGSETYGAGRYLDLDREPDGTFVVDFNLAYNPYCAYNEMFVCPITPAENRISLKLEAGEKVPQGEWVAKA